MVGWNEYAMTEDVALSVALMIIGEVSNFAAYAFTDAILVTPLGALTVVVAYRRKISIHLIPQSHWIEFLPQGASVICWQSW